MDTQRTEDSSKDKRDWPEDPSAQHLRQWISDLPKEYVFIDFDNDGPDLYYLDPNERLVKSSARYGNSGRPYEFRDDAHFWPSEKDDKSMRGWAIEHSKGKVPHKR